MSDALYEQYKDALKRGHVAALHAQLEAALAAYDEAATVAPDRSLPHVSRGTVLARLGRTAEAVAAFDAALTRSPRDEAALAGRADGLGALGRRVEAAATYDRLATVRETAGRLVEALDAARRALESAESRGRRELVRELSDRVSASPLDEPARLALEQAMRVLDADPRRVPPAPPEARPESGPGPAVGPGDETPELGPEAEEIDLVALVAAADAALEAHDTTGARDALLSIARAHRAAGRLNAALDACYVALSVAPDDADLHLELVHLYDERGWASVAEEKLGLLRRLVELDADEPAMERLAATAAARSARSA